MAIITLASVGITRLGGQTFGQQVYDQADESNVTGGLFVMPMGPARWQASIRSPQVMAPEEAGCWESLVLRLRGQQNHLALYDLLRPAPLGTLRGTLTLASSMAVGATSAVIAGGVSGGPGTGLTVKRGDWLQIGTGVGTSMLIKATADASALAGASITVTFEPPSRYAFASGTAVTWNQPVGYYKRISASTSWQVVPNARAIDGFALDLLEQWA